MARIELDGTHSGIILTSADILTDQDLSVGAACVLGIGEKTPRAVPLEHLAETGLTWAVPLGDLAALAIIGFAIVARLDVTTVARRSNDRRAVSDATGIHVIERACPGSA
jgi:hypothetical protein